AFWRMTARARVSAGTVAAVVTSPAPRSSASARKTRSAESVLSAFIAAEDRTTSFCTNCFHLVMVRSDSRPQGDLVRRIGSRVGIAAAVALVALATASASLAKPVTKTVIAGPTPLVNKIAAKLLPKSFNKTYNPDINAFFNQKTTINVGDTV